MSTISSWLDPDDNGNLLMPWQSMHHDIREGVIIFSALGLVTLLILLWAIFFRRRRRKHHRHDYPLSDVRQAVTCPLGPTVNGATIESPRRHGRRRQRRSHLPRNPTLAETGGLPPIRPEPPRLTPLNHAREPDDYTK